MRGDKSSQDWLREAGQRFGEFVDAFLNEIRGPSKDDSPPEPCGQCILLPDFLQRVGPLGWAVKRAAERKDPTVFAMLLQGWLKLLGVEAPKGVFVRNYVQKRGRPPKVQEALCAIELYRGKMTYSQVAKRLYPEDYKKNPKRTTDRTRKLIKGHLRASPIHQAKEATPDKTPRR